jgi:oligo-alginate lyase
MPPSIPITFQNRILFSSTWHGFLVVLLATGLCSVNSFAQDPPHLLLGPEDFPRLNGLARTQPWAQKQREKILAEAAAFPQSYEKKYGLKSLELPPEGAQWAHLYVCPDTGSVLEFKPPSHNVCPDNGKEYPGVPYDQIVYQDRAFALAEGARNAAIAYRLTGDRSYADKSAQILKLYADRYKSYPVHGIFGRVGDKEGGRVFSQSLDEAEWIIDIAWAYDLMRNADVFTPVERSHIEQDLIHEAAIVIANTHGGTQNMKAWKNAGIAAAGYALKDKELIDLAIDSPTGFRAEMKEYVVDGFWIEGALGYQFYAIKPLELTAQMAKRAGVNLWKQEPNLEALFVSPLAEMWPDGTTPGFNDANGGKHILQERGPLYELAYTELRNPLFAAIDLQNNRNSLEAFLFGVPSIDASSLPKPKSAVFSNAGLATLRAPQGDLTEMVKFGPHGGSHGHFDKLNDLIFAKGMVMSVDPGTQKYGVPSHFTWDRMTVAHNTLGVDEMAQTPATGKLLSWQAEPEFTAVTADAGAVYKNANLQRTALLTSEYALEITVGKSTDGNEHDFDLSYHNYGVQHADGTFSPYSGFPQKEGYQHLTENQSARIPGDFHTRFVMDEGKEMNVWVLGDGNPNQVFTGLGLGPHLTVKIPYTIVRRHGASARFVAIFEPGPTQSKIVNVTTAADGTIHIRSTKWEDAISAGEKVSYRRTPIGN